MANKKNDSKNDSTEMEQLKKEIEELKKKLEALEPTNNEPAEDEKLQEIENPYTVTNRAIDELVNPEDTMFYLSGDQIRLILAAYEFAILPTYFGEEPVTELIEYAEKLKHHLVSKGGRGRRDILRVLRVSNSQARENVNKSIFKQLFEHGREHEDEE
ncbi:ORF8 [Sulfolobus spindle-shaped virus 3]|nr:ORF8 [Sulfolobus spindle-shaped virus 3]